MNIFVFITNEENDEYQKYALLNVKELIDSEFSIKHKNLNYKDLHGQYKYYTGEIEQFSFTKIVVAAEDWKHKVSKEIEALDDKYEKTLQVNTVSDVLDKDKIELSSKEEEAVASLNDLIAIFEENVLEDLEVNYKSADIIFFIHWGGGNERVLERKERKITNFINSTKNHAKHRTCWQVFSISSVRKDIFDVTASRIEIPNDVRILHKRFQEVKKFANIKDLITKYVAEKNVTLEMEEKELIVDFLISDTIREKLRCIVKDPKVKLVLEWEGVKYYIGEESKEKEKEIIANIFSSSDNVINNKTRAFCSQLLSEGLVR